MTDELLYNHYSAPLSDKDLDMISYVDPGGNWQDIPEDFPSDRISQIYESYRQGKGSRSTYYGRLHPDSPSYTISTYFNRPGNGCNVHPEEDRAMSIREAARFQSFPDSFVFAGTQTSMHEQVGNAVPPLLARAIGERLPGKRFVDLFSGAGGLSLGLEMAGFECLLAADNDGYACETHRENLPDTPVLEIDLSERHAPGQIEQALEENHSSTEVDLVVGGPPCQGFSHANERNPDDPRNSLVENFQTAIDVLQPESFLMENVTGMKTMEDGKLFDRIKSEFRDLDYRIEWRVIKAEEYGVPQKRRRLFVAGTRTSQTDLLPFEAMFSDNNSSKPPVLTVDDAIGDLPNQTVKELHGTTTYPDVDELRPYQKYARGCYEFEEMYEEIQSNHDIQKQTRLGKF
jgi:DNA (cytosine-5)-methyltransferase 1